MPLVARMARKEAEVKNQSQNPNPNKKVVCWHCGEKGHLSTECWSNQKNRSASGGGQHKGVKGKPMNCTGSLEPSCSGGTTAATGSCELSGFGRSPHLDPEGWLRLTYDMGGAISAFPLEAKIGTETEANYVASRQLQVNSFPTVEACVCKERLNVGMECLSDPPNFYQRKQSSQ